MEKEIVALGDVSEVKRVAPSEFVLMNYGDINYTIDGKKGKFKLTPESAKDIVDEFEARKKDLVVDFDHSTLNKKLSGVGDAPASGWLGLQLCDKGIKAIVKRWTDKAKNLLENGEYRYYSPVIRFDKETKNPTAVQSVALTNHPAIHGAEALVPAHDTTNEEESMEKLSTDERRKLIGQQKELVNTIKASIDDLQSEYSKALNDLFEFAGEEEELKNDAQAFADGLMEENIKAFADIDSEIMAIKELRNNEGVLAWLTAKIEEVSASEREDKAQVLARLNAEKEAIQQKIDREKAAPRTSLSDGEEQPSVDLKEMLKLSDDASDEDVQNEIKVLSDVKEKQIEFLKLHDAENLEDINKKIKALNDDISVRDAEATVDKLMNEKNCKITESMRDWAVDFAKKDLKGFNDWYAEAPVVFTEVQETKNGEAKPIRHFSDEELEVARLFGHNPEEAYDK